MNQITTNKGTFWIHQLLQNLIVKAGLGKNSHMPFCTHFRKMSTTKLSSLSVQQRMHTKQTCNYTEATRFLKSVNWYISVKPKLVSIFLNHMKDVKSEECWISVKYACWMTTKIYSLFCSLLERKRHIETKGLLTISYWLQRVNSSNGGLEIFLNDGQKITSLVQKLSTTNIQANKHSSWIILRMKEDKKYFSA